jgi:hypothetical protein
MTATPTPASTSQENSSKNLMNQGRNIGINNDACHCGVCGATNLLKEKDQEVKP